MTTTKEATSIKATSLESDLEANSSTLVNSPPAMASKSVTPHNAESHTCTDLTPAMPPTSAENHTKASGEIQITPPDTKNKAKITPTPTTPFHSYLYYPSAIKIKKTNYSESQRSAKNTKLTSEDFPSTPSYKPQTRIKSPSIKAPSMKSLSVEAKPKAYLEPSLPNPLLFLSLPSLSNSATPTHTKDPKTI